MTALVVALGFVVALLAVLVAGLLRSHADILRALHELGVTEDKLGAIEATDSPAFSTQPGVPQPRPTEGEPTAHDISGATPTGGAARVAVQGTPHNTLVAFLSSGCLTCRDFWEAFAAGVQLPGPDTRLVVVTQGADHESPGAVASLSHPNLTVIMSSEAWNDYGVPVSPYFLLIDGPSGTVVGEGAASSWSSVADMLSRSAADGTNATPSSASANRAKGSVREADTDAALEAAGIEPDDPRLYHQPEDSP